VRVPLEHAAAITVPQSDAEWLAVADEATALLAEYLRINTTNPPGNEVVAARWLAEILRREGITADILESGPGKANLVARLPSDSSARPVVLLSHMDVVLASPERWTVDPFGGVVRDGAVWGRGALDMKGEGIAQLMTVLLLHRAGVPLRRDVILVATADEEILGGAGASWIVEHHPAIVRDAEFVLNEGGEMWEGADGKVRAVAVGTTEKTPLWLTVTARGPAGHGSRPLPGNAVHRLITALDRIVHYTTPLTVTATVAAHFRDRAPAEPDSVRRRWYADIGAALADSAAVRALTADPVINAMLRNTISVTGLHGSAKTNVIPPEATATIDVRLLPGADPAAFLHELRQLVADTAVTIEPQGHFWPASESGTETELYRAIVAATHALHPEAVIMPYMLQGFTDSYLFRGLGIASYGVRSFPVTVEEASAVHGNDERLRVEALVQGVRWYFEVVSRVAARSPSR